MSQLPLLLRISEVARELGISRSQTYLLTKSGAIPSIQIKRSVRVASAALLEWIAAQSIAQPAIEAGPTVATIGTAKVPR